MKDKCVFKKKDFESSDGMLTYVWGPSLWHFLHCMSFNYPVKPTCEEKKYYLNFIYSLENILPCRYCRENLKRNLKETSFSIRQLKNRATFSKYIYTLHNHINKMLGKKTKISFIEVRNRYENFRSRCSKKQKVKHFKIKKTKLTKNNKKCLNSNNKIQYNNKIEEGCVNPINGVKSKCLIRIVPKECRASTFKMDPKCKAYKLKTKKNISNK